MKEKEKSKDNENNKCLYLSIKFFKKQKKENDNKNDSIEGLFDYGYNRHDIKPQEIKPMKIDNNCFIILNYYNENNNLIEKKENNLDFKNDFNDILFYVRKSFENNNYQITNIFKKNMEKNEKNINSLNNNAWYVIKSDPQYYYDNYDNYNEDYILNENDIIKFGAKKYEIIKKNFKSNSKKDQNNEDNYNISNINEEAGPVFNITLKLNYNEDNKHESFYINSIIQEQREKQKEEQKEKCKICKNSKYSEENPLICLCQCKDYIHYECLKKYLHQNNNLKKIYKNNVIIYQFSNFNCDKCSFQYPLRFRITKIFMLLDFTSNFDYIILESLDDIKNDIKNINKKKSIYIIEFKDNEDINIGRNDKNDFVIEDPTVSKVHAVIKYNKDNGQLILENKSKGFGTTVLIKGNIKMKEKDINFQVGSSYIKAKIINQN